MCRHGFGAIGSDSRANSDRFTAGPRSRAGQHGVDLGLTRGGRSRSVALQRGCALQESCRVRTVWHERRALPQCRENRGRSRRAPTHIHQPGLTISPQRGGRSRRTSVRLQSPCTAPCSCAGRGHKRRSRPATRRVAPGLLSLQIFGWHCRRPTLRVRWC